MPGGCWRRGAGGWMGGGYDSRKQMHASFIHQGRLALLIEQLTLAHDDFNARYPP